MAHTGMFVVPLAGSPPQGMSPTDGRLVMGGIFQVAPQLVATNPYPNGTFYSPSGTNMTTGIAASVWSIPDVTNSSAVFFSPTDQITLTFNAAPATGGRIDLVVVKQNNVENGDADSRVNVTVVTGTASGSPVAPAVPTGAAKAAQVLINAGVTNMNAATWTNYMPSQFAVPVLQTPTLAALNTVTGVLSQLAVVTADSTAWNNGVYQWSGSAWVALPSQSSITNVSTFGTGWAATSGSTAYTPRLHRIGNIVHLVGSVSSSSGFSVSNVLTVPAAFQPPTTTSRFVGTTVTSNGGAYELLMAAGVIQFPSGYGTGASVVAGVAVPLHCMWTMD